MGFERSQIQGKYSKTKTNSETSPQNTVFFRSSKKKIENKMNISMSSGLVNITCLGINLKTFRPLKIINIALKQLSKISPNGSNMPWSWIERLSIKEMSIFPKLMNTVNEKLIISQHFLADKATFKFYIKGHS